MERKEFEKAKTLLEPVCEGDVDKKRWRAWTLLSLAYLELKNPHRAYQASLVGSSRNAPLAEFVKTKTMYILDMDDKLKQLEHTVKIDRECL